MLNRPFDRVDTAPVADDHCAGQFYKFGHDDRLKVYIPSWVFPNDKFKKSVLLEKSDHVSDLFTVKSIIVNDQNPTIPISSSRKAMRCSQADMTASTSISHPETTRLSIVTSSSSEPYFLIEASGEFALIKSDE